MKGQFYQRPRTSTFLHKRCQPFLRCRQAGAIIREHLEVGTRSLTAKSMSVESLETNFRTGQQLCAHFSEKRLNFAYCAGQVFASFLMFISAEAKVPGKNGDAQQNSTLLDIEEHRRLHFWPSLSVCGLSQRLESYGEQAAVHCTPQMRTH